MAIKIKLAIAKIDIFFPQYLICMKMMVECGEN